LACLLAPVFGAAVVLNVGPVASAAATAPVTFAQAIETSANANPNVFTYTNNVAGNTATFGTTVGATVPIDFEFESGAGSLATTLPGMQNATITMTSTTNSQVVTAFAGAFAEQAFPTGFTNTIAITRTTPASVGTGAKTNLLTVTYTGTLEGAIGGTTPQLDADTALGNTVTYSSDFLSFAGATQEDFNVAFSSWAPLVTPPTGLGINADNYFNSATAAGAATFDFAGTATVIPEPASMSTLMFGALALLLMGGRKFRFRGERSQIASM